MVVRFPRLVGGGSLGGVRFRGERVGKEKRRKKEKIERREKERGKNCFGFFDFGSG